jgi:hypothetical protein
VLFNDPRSWLETYDILVAGSEHRSWHKIITLSDAQNNNIRAIIATLRINPNKHRFQSEIISFRASSTREEVADLFNAIEGLHTIDCTWVYGWSFRATSSIAKGVVILRAVGYESVPRS